MEDSGRTSQSTRVRIALVLALLAFQLHMLTMAFAKYGVDRKPRQSNSMNGKSGNNDDAPRENIRILRNAAFSDEERKQQENRSNETASDEYTTRFSEKASRENTRFLLSSDPPYRPGYEETTSYSDSKGLPNSSNHVEVSGHKDATLHPDTAVDTDISNYGHTTISFQRISCKNRTRSQDRAGFLDKLSNPLTFITNTRIDEEIGRHSTIQESKSHQNSTIYPDITNVEDFSNSENVPHYSESPITLNDRKDNHSTTVTANYHDSTNQNNSEAGSLQTDDESKVSNINTGSHTESKQAQKASFPMDTNRSSHAKISADGTSQYKDSSDYSDAGKSSYTTTSEDRANREEIRPLDTITNEKLLSHIQVSHIKEVRTDRNRPTLLPSDAISLQIDDDIKTNNEYIISHTAALPTMETPDQKNSLISDAAIPVEGTLQYNNEASVRGTQSLLRTLSYEHAEDNANFSNEDMRIHHLKISENATHLTVDGSNTSIEYKSRYTDTIQVQETSISNNTSLPEISVNETSEYRDSLDYLNTGIFSYAVSYEDKAIKVETTSPPKSITNEEALNHTYSSSMEHAQTDQYISTHLEAVTVQKAVESKISSEYKFSRAQSLEVQETSITKDTLSSSRAEISFDGTSQYKQSPLYSKAIFSYTSNDGDRASTQETSIKTPEIIKPEKELNHTYLSSLDHTQREQDISTHTEAVGFQKTDESKTGITINEYNLWS